MPAYYQKYGGFLIAGAIDKYIYISLHPAFEEKIILKYSELENVDKIDEIKHPLFRESFKLLGINAKGLEITSLADIPAGTGLGSSGAFLVALLKSLHMYKGDFITKSELAEEACRIEIDILKDPVGKQDQYSSSFGGITCFEFKKDNTVDAYPLKISQETMFELEDNLLLFFTGFHRRSYTTLKEQYDKSVVDDLEMTDNLHFTKELGLRTKVALENNQLDVFANLMNEHWHHKKKRSKNMSNDKINEYFEVGLRSGAYAGKVIGAGGGGFIMFYAENKRSLRKAMQELGVKEVRFRFDFEGTKSVLWT